MPLDNTASIKDIITSLEDMQGINAKADLASVIGSPATANDSMATMINTIQQAKNDLADKTEQDNTEPLQTLVNNMVVGKKWASGTSMANSNKMFHVTGLPFYPSIIAIGLNSSNSTACLYWEDVFSKDKYLTTTNNGYSGFFSTGTSTQGENVMITQGEFKLYNPGFDTYNVYTWIAFE